MSTMSRSSKRVRVASINFPQGIRPYANINPYEVVLEASYPGNDHLGLQFFKETVETVGTGGPLVLTVPVISGPPVKQTVQNQTIVIVRQSGIAEDNNGYFNPSPLLPSSERVDQRRIAKIGPDQDGNEARNFQTQWAYTFELASFVSVAPNSFGGI